MAREQERKSAEASRTKLAAKRGGTVELRGKQLEQFASRVVARANELAGESDDLRQALAAYLFTELCEADVVLALEPQSKKTARYQAVAARAGDSLVLDADDLSDHVAIGAMNHKVRAVSFRRLPWSVKLALIPLARRAMWKELRAATDVLDRDNAGVRALRAHLKHEHPDVYRSNGESPRVLAGETTRMVNTAGRLDEGSVARFVDDLNRGDEETRREVKEKIRRGLALLNHLNEAIDDGPDGQ